MSASTQMVRQHRALPAAFTWYTFLYAVCWHALERSPWSSLVNVSAPPGFVLLGKTVPELEQLAVQYGQPKYRGKQLFDAVLNGARTLDDIPNIPKDWKAKLVADGVRTGRSILHHSVDSPDGGFRDWDAAPGSRALAWGLCMRVWCVTYRRQGAWVSQGSFAHDRCPARLMPPGFNDSSTVPHSRPHVIHAVNATNNNDVCPQAPASSCCSWLTGGWWRRWASPTMSRQWGQGQGRTLLSHQKGPRAQEAPQAAGSGSQCACPHRWVSDSGLCCMGSCLVSAGDQPLGQEIVGSGSWCVCPHRWVMELFSHCLVA